MNLGQRIKDYLQECKVPYQLFNHPPAIGCEKVAMARGSRLEQGAKSLLIKTKGKYVIFTLSAALKANSNRIRQILHDQKIRFATPEELLEITGAVPGALPPLGEPFWPLQLYLDPSVTANESIFFTAGILDQSIMLKSSDYLKMVTPNQVIFSRQSI